MNVNIVKNEDGIDLKDLRKFIEQCKDLPEDTVVLLDYDDSHDSTCKEVQGDEDSIVFFNW